MSDPENEQAGRVCAYLDAQDGPERLEELLQFAERLIRRGRWCVKRDDGSMPDGRLAEDVVHGVIEAVLRSPGTKGHRNIPSHVDIPVALRQIIRSCISHALVSAENATRVEIPVEKDGSDYEGSAPFWSPCEENLSDEDRAAVWVRCDGFMAIVKKRDREAYDMLVLLRDEGIDKPAQIAKRLSMPVEKVYLARKRFGALLRKHGLGEVSK